MRNILISTAGTSLLGNINHDKEGKLKEFVESGNIKSLCNELLKIKQDKRICGAEMNSVASIASKNMLKSNFYHLILVSDTDEGRFIGKILEKIYVSKKSSVVFEKSEYRVIEGLNSDDAKRFQQEGLKNLVRIIGEIVRQYGAEHILINATGGYKAQISFAGMIGQALDIPVCYMFESFSEIIELPPQPVSLDLDFWIENASLFYELEDSLQLDSPHDLFDERFSMLVDYIEEDGSYIYALTSAGQLFHETFRYRFRRRKKDFIPKSSDIPEHQKKIKYEDDNAGKHKGLSAWLEQLKRVSFVNGIYTFYYNSDLEKKNLFKIDRAENIDKIEGWFSKNGGITKFIIRITAKTSQERNAAIVWLNEFFI
ncbi:MAG: putative CRISPR-associated protein [Thermodesulfobacteriota bacterium]|nr:putative CRISPR-associated protein [Thermodesulfobacteriota bacterium]